MKKLSFSCLALVAIFLSIDTNAQLKYTSSGYLGIGTTSPNQLLHLKNADPTLLVESSLDHDGTIRLVEGTTWLGAYMTYDGGSNTFILGTHPSSNTSTGSDVKILTMLRTNGELDFYPQSTTTYSSTLVTHAKADEVKCYAVQRNGVDKFHVRGDGDVYLQGVYHASDITLKENIENIQNSMEILAQLRPVQYNFKKDESSSSSKTPRLEFGLIAQEVEQVLPNIVSNKGDSLKAIAYSEIIPLLIDAVKSQRQEIENLKEQISSNSGTKKSTSITTYSNPWTDISQPFLSQNVPNPFNEETIIKYSIPAINSYAMINLYDLSGSQIRSYSVSNTGEGEILIPASDLEPGIFIYNLIIDGEEVDSKKLMLTNLIL